MLRGHKLWGPTAMGCHGDPMAEDRLVGEDRCWPCTVANLVVGLLVAAGPVVVAVARGGAFTWGLAIGWAAVVLGFTGYRLVVKGYLPAAGPIARWTGLHERIGPGAKGGQDEGTGGSDRS